MKRIFVCLTALLIITVLSQTSAVSAASNGVNIILNGKAVTFTKDSGYPYVDDNYRTMVPLRAAMEAAGAVVGYDAAKQTAIVIMEYDRIEVPIGRDYFYDNNQKIENDTVAVTKDGRTYLPIRAVLEAGGYTVEWDEATKTVNAYSFIFNNDELLPYSTGDFATLIENLLKGNVVYINGKYYATPEYARTFNNVKSHYTGSESDLNLAIYPQKSLSDKMEFVDEFKEWVTPRDLSSRQIIFEVISIPNGYVSKGFFTNGYASKTLHEMPSLPDDFLKAPCAGTFDGIQIKVENGEILFNQNDLLDYEVLEEPILQTVYKPKNQ